MRYIIDANNLAGKMGLLGSRKDFDRQLIGLLLHYFGKKKHQVDLVFDGVDRFGDKSNVNNLRIIRAPYDGRSHSADDKIVEMVSRCSAKELRQVIVVTDDLGLLDRIKIVEIEKGVEVTKYKAKDFSLMVQNKFHQDGSGCEGEDEKKLSAKDIERINDELMRLWS